MKKYIIRSVKYLLLLCVLYFVLLWISSVTSYTEPVDMWTLFKAQLESERGPWLVAAFIGLAIFYPRFGFMRVVVDDCHVEDDRIRIDNAMAAYGYKFEGQRGDVLVYRAEGLFKRLTLMFEDEIEVRKVASGVEIVGIRRTTARVVYQLRSYLNNRRYE
ncbi:MAG: hypothetical protein IKZ32_01610 [Alistipes sp.]|nr:hypothetical protein [Alistipes sp.]